MPKNILQKYDISQVKASDYFDLKKLMLKEKYFVDLNITSEDKILHFTFTTNNLIMFNQINKENLINHYRLLLSVASLEKIYEKFDFSLNAENLMYDKNFVVKVLHRDILIKQNNSFFENFQALIISVLNPKIKFEEAKKADVATINKNKLSQKYSYLNTIEELQEQLKTDYMTLQNKKNQQIFEVSKKKIFFLQTVSMTSLMIIISSLIIGTYFGYFKLTQQYLYNQVNESYIKKDYSKILTDLSHENILDMDNTTKYILAISEIKTESFTPKQKNKFISETSLNSKTELLNFWDYMAQQKYDQAESYAKNNNNFELVQIAEKRINNSN